MRAYIPLPHGLSASGWQTRHALGEVPDASPYGFHKLAEHGIEVTFGEKTFSRPAARLADIVRRQTGGVDILEGATQARSRLRRNTDVVLAYDERTGIPASLTGSSRRYAPVLLGAGWLTTRAAAPKVHAVLAARALPRAGAVWAQCAPVLPVLGREWGVASSRLHFVPMGIDADFYCRQPMPSQSNVVVSAGEDRYRDHDLLVSAVKMVRDVRPDVWLELATLLPVGVPDDLGVVHRARLFGKIRDLYRKAAVVAIALKPTLSGSGLTVALEAMASGRPVVMTKNPGVGDYVEHGVTGLLVPPNDVDAFAAAVAELLADPSRCAEMGAAGARQVREYFTSGVMAAHLAAMMMKV
ncbi:glycosyltransferase family 4 protein [Mycobacterium sp. 141]|uniref:glycosyltransferase family 4 protein n=1 Tax=Mycobacterium sp. 141 TaxID=1120797 RepID=UPI0004768D91|nr:glycosyltransferase family 4 protein [Mycobacterium sp. 141]